MTTMLKKAFKQCKTAEGRIGLSKKKWASALSNREIRVAASCDNRHDSDQPWRVVMPKKYIVRLTDAERQTLSEVVGKLKGSSQKVRRAQVLLKADADGPCWTDAE